MIFNLQQQIMTGGLSEKHAYAAHRIRGWSQVASRMADPRDGGFAYPEYAPEILAMIQAEDYGLPFAAEWLRTNHLGEDPAEKFDVAAERPGVLSEMEAAVEAHRAGMESAEPIFDSRLKGLMAR